MILVTGGAGYIGSHTCTELLNADHQVAVFDNLGNSNIESVIHFAGLKAVGGAEQNPLAYYDNSVIGTVRLLEAMRQCRVKTLVFSSSATVYGIPKVLPYREDHRLYATNTYGMTKLVVENMLRDLYRSDPAWHIAILRYFNPVGAHASGLIGGDPQGVPNNLMPFVAQVAVGRRDFLNVWGNDYPTKDGTCVRDYIHVVDLALGHVKALGFLAAAPRCTAINLGSGVGHSVLDVVAAFERASGKALPYRVGPRRLGDIAEYFADASLAHELPGWQVERDLDAMCVDARRWQSNNPNGYKGAM